jgi:hypothetical protein
MSVINNKLTVVYIQGYGRSGSTLLDTILHQEKNSYSVGALNNIFKWSTEGQLCACGMELCQCDFWSQIDQIKNVDLSEVNHYQDLQSGFEKFSNYKKLIKGESSYQEEYKNLQEKIFFDISNISNKTIIIDSSKSTRDCTGRAFALHQYTDINVKIIHLVRDVRGVCWSTIKKTGSNERRRFTDNKFINTVRAALSWWLTNKMSLKTTAMLPAGSVITVRYEDLCDSPARELSRIGDFLQLDYSSVVEKVLNGEELDVSHNLGGNQIRFNRALKFKPDLEWRKRMPKIYRFISMLIAVRLNNFFGY